MKSVERYLTENEHLTIPDDKIPAEWFERHGIPILFWCAKCKKLTMIFNGAVNKKNELFCRPCAKMK
jgi:formylmethanofuran dehydrogenase subunit E